jgi:formylglycine-generating enzyme required for sulfatase activity
MANYQATHANSAGLADTAGPQIDRRKTTEVWTFSEHDNIWGLCDMHGNVFEWCHDWVTHSLLGTVHNDVVSSNGDALNGPIMSNPPTGAANFARIRRGGAFGHGAHEMRSAYWYYSAPHTREARIGVRLVRAL